MALQYDYIIVGSGFGGSVSALRLAQKGYKVLVIEKGKWYHANDFAQSNWNLPKWLWMPAIRFFGIMKMSIFRHIVVISGTGVGGGSLVYANTLPIPKKSFFTTGSWAQLADWETQLRPHYQTALRMLGATPNPQLFDGDIVLQKLAQKMDRADQFEHPQVAVFFEDPNNETTDPYFDGKGPKRSGCTFCGGCMTGCRHNAKNTLDKNYLYLAQQYDTTILAEQEVIDVTPIDGATGKTGYTVRTQRSTSFLKSKQAFTTQHIIFAGGVLGTVKLLLKLKKHALPRLSDKLGDDIRTNNETLISVSTLNPQLNLSKGVAIGSLLHTDDNSHLEIVRYADGSSFWKLLHLPWSTGSNSLVRLLKMLLSILRSPWRYFKLYWVNSWARSTVVLLFMQSLDSTLRLQRNKLGMLVSKMSKGKAPTPDIPESIALTKQYAQLIDGEATSFALETLAGIPSTAHILGGAVMGATPQQGVIDKNNRVFGYDNMLIIDGSMISANPGVNPSLSITAIAERAMSTIPQKRKKS